MKTNFHDKRSSIIVILDNIRSALNVGAIFRTCDAVNVEKLYLCGITAYPPHNRISKTALGATENVPWEYCKSTTKAIKKITSRITIKPSSARSEPAFPPKDGPPLTRGGSHYKIISIELTTSAVNYWDYDFKLPTVLVFGNEITGVSKKVLNASDAVVKVPMFGKKESLNVATTCGIVLYEALRQNRSN